MEKEKFLQEAKGCFLERFEALKKETGHDDIRLLAIHLDGFTHRVIVDTGADSEINQMSYSAYVSFYSSKVGKDHVFSDTKKTAEEVDNALSKFFEGFPNYYFQGNAVEILYISPEDRNKVEIGGEA